MALLALSGCTSAPPPGPSSAASTPASTASSSALPSILTQRVKAAIDAFNATANGPVADQQRVLAGLVAPGQAEQQRACPAATRTLRLEPVYSELAGAPGWTPPAGTMSGTVYSLPTLIRVYADGRLVGTDLTDLRLSVEAGDVRLAALCVS